MGWHAKICPILAKYEIVRRLYPSPPIFKPHTIEIVMNQLRNFRSNSWRYLRDVARQIFLSGSLWSYFFFVGVIMRRVPYYYYYPLLSNFANLQLYYNCMNSLLLKPCICLGWVCFYCVRGKSFEILRDVSHKREKCYNKTDEGEVVVARNSMGRPRDGDLVCCGEAIRPLPPFPTLWCEAHRLRTPDRKGRSVLCVPQKNGNRDFSLLIYYLHYGVLPDNETVMDDTLKRQRISFSTVNRFDDVRTDPQESASWEILNLSMSYRFIL